MEVVLILVTIIIISVIIFYNAIVSASNGTKRAWADVIAYEKLKNDVIPQVTKIANEYKEFESSIHSEITQLRTALSKLNPEKIEPKLLKDVELYSKKLQNGLNITMENYPELRASEVVQSLITEISNKQDNVTAAITIFNQAVEYFNNKIQQFPSSIINNAFNRLDSLEVFSDSDSSNNFEYKPNF